MCPAPGGAPAVTCSSPPSVRCDSPRLQPETPEQGGKGCTLFFLNAIRNVYYALKPKLNSRWLTWTKSAQISSQSEITGDDVDLLFLGTSPGKPTSPSRL